MFNEVSKVSNEASRRLHVLLRLKRYYKVSVMFHLYKAHILPYLERSTPAIFHAQPNVLVMLDNVQDHFLEAVNISAKDALLIFNLAPRATRRHINMLV